METIKPVTFLRNYNKAVDEVQDGEPVVLTKNGIGKAVLLSIDEWQRQKAEIWLLTDLNKAEQDFGEGEDIDTFAQKYKLGGF